MAKKWTLKAVRVNAGFTQKQVAKLLGISNKTLSAWEKGMSSPTVDRVIELCNLYGVSYDDINFLPNDTLKADESEG